jgi:spore germination cell wall hydrolase CwlJ-like protein
MKIQTLFLGAIASVLFLIGTASSDTEISFNETGLVQTNTTIEITPKEIPEPEDKMVVAIREYHSEQIQCMAENTYFEARGEPLLGQIAVNNVVLNRFNDPQKRFGNSPCEVIKQVTYNKKKRKVCQFSWRCEKNKIIKNYEKFAEVKSVAEQVYIGFHGDVTYGAKYYHANYVSPNWNLRKLIQIGQHIFYK